MQILIENAIKHNELTEEDPLQISISMNHEYLCIENSLKQKEVLNDSTKIGLRNLNAQYLVITKKNIVVEKYKNRFIVKLPLIRTIKKRYA